MLARMHRVEVRPGDGDPGAGRTGARHRRGRLRGRGPGAHRLLDPARVVGHHVDPRGLPPRARLRASPRRGQPPRARPGPRSTHAASGTADGPAGDGLRSCLPAEADPSSGCTSPRPGGRVAAGFAVLLVLEGAALITSGAGEEVRVAQGEAWAVPHGFGDWSVSGQGQLLVARPGAGWPADLGGDAGELPAVGLDVGSTWIKALALAPDGEHLATARRPHAVAHPAGRRHRDHRRRSCSPQRLGAAGRARRGAVRPTGRPRSASPGWPSRACCSTPTARPRLRCPAWFDPRGADVFAGAAGGPARGVPRGHRPAGRARWRRSPSCCTSGPAGSTWPGSPGSTCPSTSPTRSVVTGYGEVSLVARTGLLDQDTGSAVGTGADRARRRRRPAAAAAAQPARSGAAPAGCRPRWPTPCSPWPGTTTWSPRSPPAWSIPTSSTTPSAPRRRWCGSSTQPLPPERRGRPGGRRRQRGPPPAPRPVHHAGRHPDRAGAAPGAQPGRRQRRGRSGPARRGGHGAARRHRPGPGRQRGGQHRRRR